MEQDRIEYLKRVIKRTYKRYTGERTDGEATLLDVAKFFNIPVDESRKEDYSIKKFDYNTPSIEIMDEKNNISYTATYTGKAKIGLIDFSGPIQFNCVISTSPIRKEESLYFIGSETPIVTKLTFFDGEYELTFTREMPNSVFGNDEFKMVVEYSQNVVYDGKNVKQPLFTRVYKNSYKNKKIFETFDNAFTYGPNHFIKWEGSQDKYDCLRNNSVIYGINELEQKGICHYFYGICFENINVPVSSYIPLNMSVKDFPELTNNNIYQSAILFQGGTGDAIHHTLTIFKTKNPSNIIEAAAIDYGIYLKYEVIKWENFKKENGEPDHRKIVVSSKKARYPRIDDGNITSLEIRNITEVLDTEFEDDTFIQIVINELKTFANKMDIQKGIVQEELDPLSPKLFIYKSFDEICALVSANKDDYFRLIREQFEAATNINKAKGKEQAKILKPDSVHEDKL